MARCLRWAGLVAVGFALTSCAAEAPAFDPSIIPEAVQAEVVSTGIVVGECGEPPPADQEQAGARPWWELGGELICSGTLNGDPVELLVTTAPPVDGAIPVAAEVATPLFDVAAAESAAAARLNADLGGSPEVDCLERLVAIAPGRRVECRVTAEGGTAGPVDQPLDIVILDTDGAWEIDLAP